MDRAIEALEALPPDRREEVAEMVLELAEAVTAAQGVSALTEDQIADLRRRRANGFKRGDPGRIEQLLGWLKTSP